MGNSDAVVRAAAARVSPLRDGLGADAGAVDPLLDCLLQVMRLHGQPATAAALSAGLPLAAGGLTPSLLQRAAARAGFAARIVRKRLGDLDAALFPLILVLQGDTACVLLERTEEGAKLLLPESGEGEVLLSNEELAARYLGYAISVRPKFRFDARTPEVHPRPERHWFWGAIAGQLPLYRDVLAAALLINLFALALPVFTMNVYDRVVPNFAVDTLWMLTAGLVLVLGSDYVVRMLRGHFIDLAGSRIDVQLSSLIMERVLGMRLENRPSSVGAYAATLRSFEQVRDFIASATITALVDLPFAVLFLLVVAWIAWPLAFIPVLALAGVIAYSWLVQKRMHELAETTFRASAQRNAAVVEALTALETIKSHGAERVVQTKLENTSVFLARTTAQLRLLSASVVNGVGSLQQLCTVLMVVAGVYLINDGHLTTGGLVACTMLAGRALAPLGQLVALLMQYQNARSALLSLERTMNLPAERSEQAQFVHRPQFAGEIAFDDVHFNYPGAPDEALKGVSLRIRPGEKVVVIGRIGSGKTTLQRLVLGLYKPTSGTVTIDGVDLRQVDPADLRRSIGYVEQEAMLFFGTLRENIAIAAPAADDAAVLAAAEVAGLTEFVNRHPKGFGMPVGERGETLSGGQRQGVAIARAVLLDPPVLLLDEPTGSMDFSTEARFIERMRSFAADKTLLVVTHRSSLLELATRIVVLDDGRIVADGPRDQVMADLKAGKVGRAA